MPGVLLSYFERGPLTFEDPADYADPDARLTSAANVSWLHPPLESVTGLINAGLSLLARRSR